MPFAAALAVLGAAALHASWNALLRAGGDRLNAVTLISLTSAAAGGVGTLILPPPAGAAWPCIGLSSVLQTLYCIGLARAYDSGRLAQIYPVARGVSPLLVSLGALALAGERPSPAGLAGVCLVSLGIFAVAFGSQRPEARALRAALLVGVLIAAYTLTDGTGGRLSGSVIGYACWLFLVQGLVMAAVFGLLRRRPLAISMDASTAKAILGGLFSFLAYAVVVWALSLAPMGQVSALRETGILFAMAIGVIFLKERPGAAQLVAGAAIAAGAVLLA